MKKKPIQMMRASFFERTLIPRNVALRNYFNALLIATN